ncbi:hypothetical protein CONLIGDRAFT_640250 [Coniochaeta ligniaria NRRL 30616]|uniref:Uncharacterized protein n=1 Tax=Coniochaeta ligniaria NRRL 30616 TaxID=1408157 RepID=A0A1J7IZB8_9PEZI|nr:hypothetical protein CONLIGDRAFT_640250 [Coniochaeta ligniaria NRRL 30616]
MSDLPRTPRLWTDEQVKFVLEQISTGKRHKDIAALFNAKYDGTGKIDTEQVKYIKAQYRNREITTHSAQNFPGGNTKAQPEPTSSETTTTRTTTSLSRNIQIPPTFSPATSTPAQNNGVSSGLGADTGAFGTTQTTNGPAKTLAHSRPKQSRVAVSSAAWVPHRDIAEDDTNMADAPRNDRVYPLSPLQHKPPTTSQPAEWSPGPAFLSMENRWNQGPHEECDLQAIHRHEADGGITFPSVTAVKDMFRRMNPAVRLSDLADMMERDEARSRE